MEQWWEFDDEHVSNLGQHPFGEGSSNSATKPVQTEPFVHPCCSESTVAIGTGNHMDVGQLQSSQSNVLVHVPTFSSSDAYMLTYILRHSRNGSEKTDMESGGFQMEKEGDIVSPKNDVSLPILLCEEVKQLNESYLHACEQYKSKKELELDHITERRQEVRMVLSEAPVQSPGESYYWISIDWLRHWADNITSS
ncbi:hypothetical protein F0562_033081 [Nyssa sinensis]|uniref:DUSP domain-containing protein n=1 Tax=Nyssa sinensis TaxID=561372 RepID=A0A5J5AU63_9ASTE|nr:hypothetical protein F0562_033081 [Nyssa sinensis]